MSPSLRTQTARRGYEKQRTKGLRIRSPHRAARVRGMQHHEAQAHHANAKYRDAHTAQPRLEAHDGVAGRMHRCVLRSSEVGRVQKDVSCPSTPARLPHLQCLRGAVIRLSAGVICSRLSMLIPLSSRRSTKVSNPMHLRATRQRLSLIGSKVQSPLPSKLGTSLCTTTGRHGSSTVLPSGVHPARPTPAKH